MDPSAELLDPAAQAVLRRLAAFVSGWELAAEAVSAGEDVEAESVLAILDELLDRSLVQVHSAQRPRLVVAAALEELGAEAVQHGQAQHGVHLLAAATTRRQAMGTPVRPADCPALEGALAAARLALGDAAYAEAWASGESLPLEQVVAQAGAASGATPGPSSARSPTNVRPSHTTLSPPAAPFQNRPPAQNAPLRSEHRPLSDTQWAAIAALLPPPARTGRPRASDRQTIEAILYKLETGCAWRSLPAGFGDGLMAYRHWRAWCTQRVSGRRSRRSCGTSFPDGTRQRL